MKIGDGIYGKQRSQRLLTTGRCPWFWLGLPSPLLRVPSLCKPRFQCYSITTKAPEIVNTVSCPSFPPPALKTTVMQALPITPASLSVHPARQSPAVSATRGDSCRRPETRWRRQLAICALGFQRLVCFFLLVTIAQKRHCELRMLLQHHICLGHWLRALRGG